MVKTLSKKFPKSFKLFLSKEDPFDPLWNDWQFIGFLVNEGMELNLSRGNFTLRFRGKIFHRTITKDPLGTLIEAAFKLMETELAQKKIQNAI